MCNFFSCIVMRDGRILTAPDSQSHESIIKLHGLKDDKLDDRDFVKVEIIPNAPELIFSKDRTNWTFRLDEPKTIPVWFEEDSTKFINSAWDAWQKRMDVIPLVDDAVEKAKNIYDYLSDVADVKHKFNTQIVRANLFSYLFDFMINAHKSGKSMMSVRAIGAVVLDYDKLCEVANQNTSEED